MSNPTSRIPAPGLFPKAKIGPNFSTAMPTAQDKSSRAPARSKVGVGSIRPSPLRSDATKEANTKPHAPLGSQQIQTPRSKRQSQFVAAHMGIPCTLGALDHQLTCDHKISTDQPEPCASNCQPLHPSSRRDFEPYVCMTCIVSEIKKKHEEKVQSFQREMRAIASAAKKDLDREDVARRLAVIEIGWQEIDLKEMRERVGYGRWSRPFYVEPEYEGAAQTIAEEHRDLDVEETESISSTASSRGQSVSQAASSRAASSASSGTSLTASESAGSSSARGSKLPLRPALRRS